MSDWTDGKNYSGQTVRNISFHGAKIVGADLTNASIDGEIDGLTINGIEIAPLIARAMDDLYPERKQLFATDPEGIQQAYDIVFGQIDETIERVRTLPEDLRYVRVDDEWSVTETIRHLVFAVDAWILRGVLGRKDPFDPIALPPSFLPATAPGMSCDPNANPTFDETVAVWKKRERLIRNLIDGLTPETLQRPIVMAGDGYPPAGHETQVIGPLWTILDETWWHNRYMNRDLDTIEKESR